ncbi:MAG: hypothetical protein M0R17_02730 [Candidatus Omnitrophica bacterium]|jgi:hypothetical protein|nr:hypothetical protein [Candidatus Omnitrophota bacterium]
MITKEIEIDKKELVVTGKEKVTVYITLDGKEYKDLPNAEEHEANLISFEQFKEEFKYTTIDNDKNRIILYIKELNHKVRRLLQKNISYEISTYNIKPNNWHYIELDKSGDYDICNICTIEDFIISNKNDIKDLENLNKQLEQYV